ncbi:hypothetical protein IDH44_15035 [Paenibacillus sp. IB182496]|uniref:Uncharacterized protein n=1 Tax=Paenibacillus sabuli TaxID=2772509 RepID=A0A927BVZ4_9BACL|nr:hypothetical protein [Paenibacillus sabuli]MBD2846514.1 hypothetical protein [Paenibacillus sabuli]
MSIAVFLGNGLKKQLTWKGRTSMGQGLMADKSHPRLVTLEKGAPVAPQQINSAHSGGISKRGTIDVMRQLQASVGNQSALQMMTTPLQRIGNAVNQRPPRNAPMAIPIAVPVAPVPQAIPPLPQAIPPASSQAPTGLGLMGHRLREASANGTMGQAEDYQAEDIAFDNINALLDISSAGVGGQSEVYDDLSDSLKDSIEEGEKNQQDVSKLKDDKARADHQNQRLGVAAGLLDVGAGFIGLLNMKKAIKESKNRSETAGALYEGLESGQKVFSGVANVVDNAAKLEGHEDGIGSSEAVAGYSGSIGDALSSIKSAFFMVKSIFELYREANSNEGLSKKELFRGGLDVVQNGLEAASSAVKTVKSILEILESGVGKLGQVIPGIGIAISGIKLTIKVYNMIQWNTSRGKMTQIKRDFKTKYASSGVVVHKSYSLFGRRLHESQGTNKLLLEQRKNELAAILDPANAATDAEKEQAELELNDIEDYSLAKEMKNINQKRMTRAGIEAGLEMATIAGDIATLSGAASAVGVSLKAAAGGAKVGMGLFRRMKQFGRDKAAKQDSSRVWSAVFNAEKSSDKKHNRRSRDAELILNMVSKLPDRANTEEERGQYKRVLNYIEATGCSTKALFRENGDVIKQRELLIEAMKKRD